MLNPDEKRRYLRHTMLKGFGPEAQERLKEGSVLCIGIGGLGSPAALYLTAAGVGRIGLVDFDQVSESNLQRQILFSTESVGASKLETAKARLLDLNPHIEIVTHETRFTAENAMELVGSYDVILDGSDNFPTRFASADASVLLQKPNVYGSIYQFEGQSAVFAPHLGGPCYRCMLPEPPPEGVAPT